MWMSNLSNKADVWVKKAFGKEHYPTFGKTVSPPSSTSCRYINPVANLSTNKRERLRGCYSNSITKSSPVAPVDIRILMAEIVMVRIIPLTLL